MAKIIVYCDGACEPCNPGGYATWGWVAFLDGKEISHGSGCVGHGPGMTNNRAEYEAVLQVLRRAQKKGVSVHIRTDSQLVVKQVCGQWAVRALHLTHFRDEAARLLQATGSSLSWVRREENVRADELSKHAYHAAARKGDRHGTD
jgi:ribonuclease HI